MDRIKERAEQAVEKYDYSYLYHYQDIAEDCFKEGFTEGALQQRDLDIEKAINWLVAEGFFGCPDSKGARGLRKVMEED